MSWPSCVVIYIDMPELKKHASAAAPTGSSLMRAFHSLVGRALAPGLLPSLAHAYVWNDSALLLAYVDGTRSGDEACLRDADRLKLTIDEWMQTWTTKRSYAIAVKGQAFPEPCGAGAAANRVIILRASSYAMGNCFEIDKEVKRCKLRKSWYLDDRLAKHIRGVTARDVLLVKLLPKSRQCKVHLIDGYLWGERSGR